MKENKLVDLSLALAVDIVNLSKTMQGPSALTNQLLRSGTSIGANIHEANYAQSRADFIAKLHIALKECYESEYWLVLFQKTDLLSQDEVAKLWSQCGTIRRILVASLNTAKSATLASSSIAEDVMEYTPFP